MADIELGLSLAVSPREHIDRAVALARRAEDLGIAAIWVLDSQALYQESYVTLAVLARETDRIQLGPGVTNLLTRHPSVVASAMSTLGRLAPGRIAVGLGTGDSAVRRIGLTPMRLGELSDGVANLRALMAGEQVSGEHHGEYNVRSAGDGTVPIYVGGTQPRMLETCGAIADGVIMVGPADPASVADQLAAIRRGAEAAGRDPATIKTDLWVGLSIGAGDGPTEDLRSYASTQARMLAHRDDLPESLARFRGEMDAAARSYDYEQHLRVGADHGRSVSPEFTRTVAVAGTFEECLQRVQQLAALDLDRLSVTLLPGGRERRLEQIADLWDAL